MKESFVQVYTGNGKGKTTAAFGLALRAAGRGKLVKIVQFLKGMDTGEIFAVRSVNNIEVKRVSECKKFFNTMTEEEKREIRDDACAVLPVIKGWLGKDALLILDESLSALGCGILKKEELFDIIDNRGKTEIVLTGRDAPDYIIGKADLVTEMKEIKHYYNEGIQAREGIEY